MKRYFNIVNGMVVPLRDGDETGLYSIECADQQEYLNSACPDNLVFENDAIRWKTEEEKERERLDSMRSLDKIAILEALDELPDERAKYDTLMQNAKFAERWGATLQLDLDHPLTKQALAQVDMDVDAIKRAIIAAETTL